MGCSYYDEDYERSRETNQQNTETEQDTVAAKNRVKMEYLADLTTSPDDLGEFRSICLVFVCFMVNYFDFCFPYLPLTVF